MICPMTATICAEEEQPPRYGSRRERALPGPRLRPARTAVIPTLSDAARHAASAGQAPAGGSPLLPASFSRYPLGQPENL
jgi:hypothetical protein